MIVDLWAVTPLGRRGSQCRSLRASHESLRRAGHVMTGAGFAVLDLETTGLSPSYHHRVVEVGVVLVDPSGCVEREWTTMVDPQRDVGPISVHGLRASLMVGAPTFREIADELLALVRGRVPVAHNLPFDRRFLAAEYARMGYALPLEGHGLCTMSLAMRYLPTAPRALDECCAAAGWVHQDAHTALADARSTARLLRYFLCCASAEFLEVVDAAPGWGWPPEPATDGRSHAVPRPASAIPAQAVSPDQHFLARLVPSLPRVPTPVNADPYLAVLDDVLADRRVDAGEADGLLALAADLSLDRDTVISLHERYLTSLARAAWEDGFIEDHELFDLKQVAALLGLPESAVGVALERGRGFTGALPSGALSLSPGDRVCFTGEMSRPRADLEALAAAAGLVPVSNVSRKTSFLVCADAESLSGKARKAREVGTTVISEPKFMQLLSHARTAAGQPCTMSGSTEVDA